MTLHTIEIGIAPEDALKVFRGLEMRNEQENWQLIQQNQGPDWVEFCVWIEGCDTTTKIVLNGEGQWRMTTHISLGEKLDGTKD